MGPAGDERTDKTRRRRALQVEMAEGFGAPPSPAALNLSHVGMRHERRQVRANIGWDASTVILGRPTNSSFPNPFVDRHGTLNRVASWREGADGKSRRDVRGKLTDGDKMCGMTRTEQPFYCRRHDVESQFWWKETGQASTTDWLPSL